MSSLRQSIESVVTTLRGRVAAEWLPPQVAIVLGSGLGAFADRLPQPIVVPYAEVPGLPRSTVAGHAGRFVLGRLSGLSVIVLQGRAHLYEGVTPEESVRGLRAAIHLGARTVVLTNAAGSLDPSFAPGDIVLIDDHVNFAGWNPLRGANDDTLGTRFPDLTEAYDRRLKALVERAAIHVGIGLRRGVYAFVGGPSYETPAEVRALRVLGADLVGMSTVPETVAAVHMGARVVALSIVTNLAAGLGTGVLSHDEVQAVGAEARDRVGALIDALLGGIAGEPS